MMWQMNTFQTNRQDKSPEKLRGWKKVFHTMENKRKVKLQ